MHIDLVYNMTVAFMAVYLKYVSSHCGLFINELEYLRVVNELSVGRTVWYVVSRLGAFHGWNV
jgi:hypothetical protein